MQIAISATFWHQPTVGSGQYLRGLLAELPTYAPQHHYTLLIPAIHASAGTGALANRDPRINTVVVATPFDTRSRALAKLWFEQIGAPQAAQRIGADVLHVPYWAPPLVAPVPVVASVLDVIPLLLPAYRGSALVRAYTRLVVAGTQRARQVIAISACTGQQIAQHIGIPAERVTVIPLAAGAQYQPIDKAQARAEVGARYGLPERFVYYVGGLDVRKNVASLVAGYAHMRHAGGPEVPLVIAGQALGKNPTLFPDLDAQIAAVGAKQWVQRITVPPADGPLLYSAAELFAYPSRYEGFGLGPLEAMACGTPVIVADATSLPEVVGDAALRVGPDDIPGWATALERLLRDPALAAALRVRGSARAAQFSYAKTAAQTVQVYERMAR